MVSNNHELDESLQNKLSLIESVPARNPQKAALGREAFMNQVEALQIRNATPIVAPKQENLKRLWGFRLSFASLAATLILTLMVVGAGTWGTVYAAQGSLPGDFLYSIKQMDENLHLTLAGEPETKIELLSSYTDRRIDEAIQLTSEGQPIPESLLTQYEMQYDEIFSLVANMDDPTMAKALAGVQRHLRDQDRDMGRVMKSLPVNVDPLLVRLQARLLYCEQLAGSAIDEPAVEKPNTAQQPKNQENKSDITATDLITPTLTLTPTLTITPTATITPTLPGKSVTVTPGQYEYGPGPCETQRNCKPSDDGPGPGPFDGTPTPPREDQGYGPGPDKGQAPEKTSLAPSPSNTPQPDETTEPLKKDDNQHKKAKP